MSLWALGQTLDLKNEVIPDAKSIEEKQQIVGYKNIVVDRAASTVFLKVKGAQIDLGGIIKGYAVDKVVEVLHQNGIRSGVIAVAGKSDRLERNLMANHGRSGCRTPGRKVLMMQSSQPLNSPARPSQPQEITLDISKRTVCDIIIFWIRRQVILRINVEAPR